MKRPAAGLSRVFSRLLSPDSAVLILSKYCLTLVNSRNTGCSLALTPFNRRKAVSDQLRISNCVTGKAIQKSNDSIA